MTEIDIVSIAAIIGIVIAYSEIRYKALIPWIKEQKECINRIESKLDTLHDKIKQSSFKK